MRGVVLADTGPLYAAADPDDFFHAKSLEEQERLEAGNLKVMVSYATLQEAYALVLRRLGNTLARSFLEDLTQTTIFITPDRGGPQEGHRAYTPLPGPGHLVG